MLLLFLILFDTKLLRWLQPSLLSSHAPTCCCRLFIGTDMIHSPFRCHLLGQKEQSIQTSNNLLWFNGMDVLAEPEGDERLHLVPYDSLHTQPGIDWNVGAGWGLYWFYADATTYWLRRNCRTELWTSYGKCVGLKGPQGFYNHRIRDTCLTLAIQMTTYSVHFRKG